MIGLLVVFIPVEDCYRAETYTSNNQCYYCMFGLLVVSIPEVECLELMVTYSCIDDGAVCLYGKLGWYIRFSNVVTCLEETRRDYSAAFF